MPKHKSKKADLQKSKQATPKVYITLSYSMLEGDIDEKDIDKTKEVTFVLPEDMTIKGRYVGGYKLTCAVTKDNLKKLFANGSANIAFLQDKQIQLWHSDLPTFPIYPKLLSLTLKDLHNKSPSAPLSKSSQEDLEPTPSKDGIRAMSLLRRISRMFQRSAAQ